MKWILLIALFALAFGGGGRRLQALLGSLKKVPDDFKLAKGRAEDPVAHARVVGGRSASAGSGEQITMPPGDGREPEASRDA